MTLEEKINLFLEAKIKVNKKDYGGKDLVDLANEKENEKNKDDKPVDAQTAWTRSLSNNDGLDDDPSENYRKTNLEEKIKIYNTLIPIELDNFLYEELSAKENIRFKIIKATLKYVDIESVKKAFPEHSNSSKKEIIKFLKEKLDSLQEEKKRKLINSHIVKEANIRASKGVVGGRIAGTATGIGAGAGTVMATTTGIEVGTGATSGSFVAALGAVLLLPIHIIIGIGTLALAAITGIVLGATALSNKHTKQRKATMMSEKEIIEAVKSDKQEYGLSE